ncbi:MAG: bifunctional nuclease family protein, partial [Desulfobacterales bacterium]|nr:bifunctional nuclease family protein [Desulfobacterales bacterium]
RPMTHDLFKNFLDYQSVVISRVDICDLIENTFHALIHFASKNGFFTMDARPSDAIALAVRFKAPIYVDDKVIDKSRPSEQKGEAVDKSEEGKKWADYLSKLSPEDFGKYKV